MSLIQDALKRKNEEGPPHQSAPHPFDQESHRPVAPHPIPNSPHPNPPPPPPQAPKRRRMELFLLLILIGSYIYFYFSRNESPPNSESAVAQSTEPTLVAAPTQPETTPKPMPKPEPKPTQEPEKPKNEEPPKPLVWPELEFLGSATAGGQSLAIINGKMLAVGENIDGVTLIEISKTQILVEFQGIQKTVRLGIK